MKTLRLGQMFSVKRRFSQEEVLSFAKLSGDNNPLHYDLGFCKETVFKQPIIHGMLGASLFSNLLGNNITGSIYISQTLRFLKPIYIDEEIEAIVKIGNIIKDKKQIILTTQIFKVEDRLLAVDGEAVIKFPIEGYNFI
jgi:acyl dehydratase